MDVDQKNEIVSFNVKCTPDNNFIIQENSKLEFPGWWFLNYR